MRSHAFRVLCFVAAHFPPVNRLMDRVSSLIHVMFAASLAFALVWGSAALAEIGRAHV